MRIQNVLLSLSILILLSSHVYAQDVGDTAPDFVLETLDGTDFKLSNHEGKVVFIFFFGYACPHCLANGPNTQTGIYDIYKENEAFVAVGIDTWDGNKSGVENYKAATGIEYTLCLMGSDLEQAYETTYDRIVIVDKEGIIRYKATANATSDIVDQASSVIETYLNKETMNGGEDDDMMGVITGIIEETDNEEMILYPLPARSELFIESSILNDPNLYIKIVDQTGRSNYDVTFGRYNEKSIIVSVNKLEDGLYFLHISGSNQIISKKFLVLK